MRDMWPLFVVVGAIVAGSVTLAWWDFESNRYSCTEYAEPATKVETFSYRGQTVTAPVSQPQRCLAWRRRY